MKQGSKLSETTKLQQRVNDLEALVNKKDALLLEINKCTAIELSETGLRIDINNLSNATLGVKGSGDQKKALTHEVAVPCGEVNNG